jgi:hypothetical protein
MSEEIIKKIQELIDAGKGDSERLHNILNSLQNNQPLELSDKQYIESLSLAESETKYDSITFENTSESIDEPNLNDNPEANETPSKKVSFDNRKKVTIAIIAIAVIITGYVAVDVYSAGTLEIRPHKGSQYALSETTLHVQAEACNPSYFPASFHSYEISAIYNSTVLESVFVNGSTFSPKSSSLLDGVFTINKDALTKFAQQGTQFDVNKAIVKTKLSAPIFGIIPFAINKEYAGTEFAQIVSNGPSGSYHC